MSIEIIKSSARSRFGEVFSYLNFLSTLEPKDLSPASLELKIMRGLFYVHLYSVIEKTINELVEDILISIKIDNIKNKDLKIHVNTISLYSKLQSFKDCNSKNFFDKANDIFSCIESDHVYPFNETMMSLFLQNIHYSSLVKITELFGVNGFIANPVHSLIIEEITGKRNAVAHGRESASIVGQTHSTNRLREIMLTTQEIIFSYIDIFEAYISTKAYIKDNCRECYLLTSLP